MTRNRYTRKFRIQVAKEALRPEYEGLEHVIAEKYDVRVNSIKRWKEQYLQFGDRAFIKGYTIRPQKTSKEIELRRK